MDTRGSGRELFVSAMEGIPPLNDLVTTALVSSIRNNHQRRFFQPYLIDRFGDRGKYQGQQLNEGNGKAGSASDPNWNGRADPGWSPDGTSIAYWQALVTAPECGGSNPLPCPKSTEPGGRRVRLMIARLTSRDPVRPRKVAMFSGDVPWGTPFVPGSPPFLRPHVPAGTYTLRGQESGDATVQITVDPEGLAIASVGVEYHDYSDDGVHIINGTESVSGGGALDIHVVWHSDLTLTGRHKGTKVTSEPGGFVVDINLEETIFHATGTLTTTIDHKVYEQPANAT